MYFLQFTLVMMVIVRKCSTAPSMKATVLLCSLRKGHLVCLANSTLAITLNTTMACANPMIRSNCEHAHTNTITLSSEMYTLTLYVMLQLLQKRPFRWNSFTTFCITARIWNRLKPQVHRMSSPLASLAPLLVYCAGMSDCTF